MGDYVVGIDVGTTGTKTMLFSADGTTSAHTYVGYKLENPALGYSEQNSEDWWKAVCGTVREVLKKCPDPENVRAISLSLQGGTVVPVDEKGNPLRPAIVWNDTRCRKEREEFERIYGSSYMYEKTGWRLSDGLPALEIRWMKDNEPDIFDRTAMFLSVPDYISLRMTGRAVADVADAGINQLYDIRAEEYDENLLRFAGISAGQLPDVVHTGDVIGHLTAEAAAALGLSERTVLVAGAHDQYAVAVGAGADKAGDILIGSGTCWVVTAISSKPRFDTGFSQSVAAVRGMWGSILSLSTGGVCLDWLRKNIAVGEDGEEYIGYDRINEELKNRFPAKERLFFYPFSGYFGGREEFGKAAFTGLDLSHDRYDMFAAVMEGVAFQIAWMLEAFQEYRTCGCLRLAGGASKSRVWSQIVADITGHAVLIPSVPDLACVGAAVIAGTGCGVYRSVEEGCRALAVSGKIVEPDPEKSRQYQSCFADYKECAKKIGELYH